MAPSRSPVSARAQAREDDGSGVELGISARACCKVSSASRGCSAWLWVVANASQRISDFGSQVVIRLRRSIALVERPAQAKEIGQLKGPGRLIGPQHEIVEGLFKSRLVGRQDLCQSPRSSNANRAKGILEKWLESGSGLWADIRQRGRQPLPAQADPGPSEVLERPA